MSFSVLGKRFDHMWIGFVSVGLQGIHNHAESAARHNGTSERSLSLKTHDDFVLAINVAWAMSGDGTWNLGDVKHTFLSLFHKKFVQPIPQVLGPLGCGRKEGPFSLIWLVVLLDEVTNINLLLPETRLESLPWGNHFL
jgi:hypothetical protein